MTTTEDAISIIKTAIEELYRDTGIRITNIEPNWLCASFLNSDKHHEIKELHVQVAK